MTRFLANLLFIIIFNTGSVLLAAALVPTAFLSAEALRRGSRLWARYYLGCARLILGVRVAVRGHVPQADAIVAFKHQSAFETILTLALFEWPAVVMKAELRRIPLWGLLAARHGSIFVDRGSGGAALRAMVRQARARMAEHRPIVIFPEGTRIPYGETAPIRAGLYALAAATRLPVVPVALDAGRLWPRGLKPRRGTITLAFQPPIPAGLGREAFEARVVAAINADPVSVAVAA
jgi:1-acyl-sn-glycerol-3-phosphate acyltransferase